MCGGAIISDFIPAAVTARSRRVTADYLWLDLKKRASQVIHSDDDFEADFRNFKDDSDSDADHQVKPFAFSASSRNFSLPSSHFSFSFPFISYAKSSLFTLFSLLIFGTFVSCSPCDMNFWTLNFKVNLISDFRSWSS